MWAKIPMCDLCRVDGKLSLGIIEYIGETDFPLHACSRHLKLVKEAGLNYWELPKGLLDYSGI